MTELTPIQQFDGWQAKREDHAGWLGPDRPSGAKVRAYGRMIEARPPGLPLVVGCGASSAIQVYIADAARRYGRQAYVAVPARKERHPSTQWAAAHGALITEVRPGYRSVVEDRARKIVPEPYVHWDPALAASDSAEQVANVPPGSTLVVPTGSGLIVAGIIGGLCQEGKAAHVRIVGVGGRAQLSTVYGLVRRLFGIDYLETAVEVSLVAAPMPYNTRVRAELPDGSPLDPYYAAKALPYVGPGDILWVTGRRPEAAGWGANP